MCLRIAAQKDSEMERNAGITSAVQINSNMRNHRTGNFSGPS